MSGDFVSNLLDKLSQKTGRQWTLNDIMKLAEKMPKGGANVDALLDELGNMGFEVPEETKERVRDRVKDGESISMEELGNLMPKEVKAKSRKSKKQIKPIRANAKSKSVSLSGRIKKLSGKGKKKR
ncbi:MULTISPECIES: hypothetical protein [Brevibacillus]|uniref:Uncharacterized protein n=1 Tax=Brevibacillus porteri TaxID=2126350 RepID=A0ABX5FSS1_9BACL|nr:MULTISPECIES: hypothetical protein [Brevibacillus]MDC0761221.1 hypothetical protein [Brevibacillus sp. AG]MED1800534.1 hypothetical protein [Brevibacillus porteri]MED2132717.1 hypothetical protein [Brevibacillus porteri]MED2743274.1 hypothetical protein [Brevibacillus porteri]MED2816200.1 hypothetical protein [Brevibacillus porteri]